MSVTLTTAAFKQLSKLAINAKKHILFGCSSGGCAGFEYTWDYIDKSPTPKLAVPLVGPYTLNVCGKSELYVLGTGIDYRTGGFSPGFLYKNPNVTQACGCSLSFLPTHSRINSRALK
jgi:iron-sulfur cluster assembly protein